MNENIDCIGILKYLEKYAGKEYCSNSKRTPENRKIMEENEAAGKKATKELVKMAKICEEYFGLKGEVTNSWLDGSKVKLRKYLWIQLKKPDKFNKPESISLFVEPSDTGKISRFRFSLEINNKKAKKIKGEMERYHKHLDLRLNKEKELIYVSGSNEKGNISIIQESQEEVIKGLHLGKYEKVQISKIVEWTENLTNEECINKMIEAVEELLPYYEYVVGDLTYKEAFNKMNNSLKSAKLDKNMIFYGPPGTGKTYNTAIYAVAICDEKSIEELKNYEYKDIIKRYKELKAEGRIAFTTFHQSYGYEEFIEGIKPVMNEEEVDKDLKYTIESGIFKKFCEDVETLKIVGINNKKEKIDSKKRNYVFIIDEINRGNISKIFGELITLIEPTKRIGEKEEIKVRLPYSKTEFGVPNNVYIIGTMNTSDKSIAQIDTALRRRFEFIEIAPDVEILKNIKIDNLDIVKMLDTINQRIEILYDKEHTIGHAFFMNLKEEPTLERLASIFEKSIIPLLEEYFYEDYVKIQLVLGEKIVKKQKIDISKIFKNNIEAIDLPEEKYIISKEALKSIESYIEIYE